MTTFLLSKEFFLWGAPALAVAATPTASTLPAGGVADSPATVTTATPRSTDVEPAPAAQRGDLASLAGANGAQSVEDVERIVREAVGVEVKVVEGGATPARSRAADTIGRSFNATLVTS